MKMIQSHEEFKTAISTGTSVVVFSADWCPDCVVIKPILPEIEEAFTQYQFLYVDRDQHIELCQELDIFGIPSFVVFHNGEEIDRYVDKQRKTKEQITAFLNNLSFNA
ncbi:Thiol-disulfide isomerase and thioredoxin [Fictibacillus macauensis ZFHKF-1]|uniref:Thiol-disulfide isomerase and thioredoxin n=1 Tax=Fictibacillus macauensis ZFHKF-1 TaxID=1196324 RepID=I8UF44_9BACL|nr:thioredoxin family protein [Fictibacillus macauensis]EIT85495.1 Thiol-disulfide isomerase and thioredoxin [Fictibacillus macauensis ZFHKF-1]